MWTKSSAGKETKRDLTLAMRSIRGSDPMQKHHGIKENQTLPGSSRSKNAFFNVFLYERLIGNIGFVGFFFDAV